MYEHVRDTSRWILPEVLAWQAEVNGSKSFVEIVDGPSVTYGEANERAEKVAAHFQSLGVQTGDTIAVLLPNGLDFVDTWLGLTRLGAVAVLLNTELKGGYLRHQLQDSRARLAVADASTLPAIADLDGEIGALEHLVVAGTTEVTVSGVKASRLEAWHDAERYTGPMPRAADVATIMYTSGTTGPSKGVLMPHAHCYLYGLGAIDNLAVTQDDRYYVTLPLYHANGLLMQVGACLIAGATAVVRSRFSAQNWLSDVRRYRTTITNSLGVVSPFIFAQPKSDADRDHALRLVCAAPNPSALKQVWHDRFGVRDVVGGFGMTEVNIPVWGRAGVEAPDNSAGLVYDRYFHVEIVDPETDAPVEHGQVGEIVVRPKAPFGFMSGYFNLPEKTCEAWQNLWFHTGDAGILDENGFLFFVDRIRDCIRHRGHNISSFEVERALLSRDGVVEAAAYAVASEITGGEDEVMVSVVLDGESSLTPRDLFDHAERELPRFAQPRFIEITADLPKTQTGKVQKAELRKRGLPAGVWDRKAEGLAPGGQSSRNIREEVN